MIWKQTTWDEGNGLQRSRRQWYKFAFEQYFGWFPVSRFIIDTENVHN